MVISDAFAQATAPAAGPFGGEIMSFLPIIFMFVLLYVLMIRPQQKRAKEHKAMLDALQKGDEIVTNGGALGRVAKVGDNYVTVEVAPNVHIQVQRQAIQTVLPKGTFKPASAKEL